MQGSLPKSQAEFPCGLSLETTLLSMSETLSKASYKILGVYTRLGFIHDAKVKKGPS